MFIKVELFCNLVEKEGKMKIYYCEFPALKKEKNQEI
jgi:hypothetical protein